MLARSLDRDSDPVRFLRNRVFRLFPAAMAVVRCLPCCTGNSACSSDRSVVRSVRRDPEFADYPERHQWRDVVDDGRMRCDAADPDERLAVSQSGERPLWSLVAVLFGLSFWGSYVHLLGGFTNLAPFYAFVIGVLVHFKGVRIASLAGPGLATAVGITAIAVYIYCGAKKQTAPILMIECLSAATLVALIAGRPAMALFRPLDLGRSGFMGGFRTAFICSTCWASRSHSASSIRWSTRPESRYP